MFENVFENLNKKNEIQTTSEGGAIAKSDFLKSGGTTDEDKDLIFTSTPSPHPRDPRPDLFADHALWDRLLAVAYRRFHDAPGSLYPALHYMRCLGTGLAKTEEKEIALPQCLDGTKKLKVSLKLFPHIFPGDAVGADGWQNQAEYDREKARALSPLMVQLIAVLAEVSLIIKREDSKAA